MLQLLRNNNISNVFILLFYLIGVRFISFIKPVTITDPDGGFGYFLIMNALDGIGISYSLVGAMLIFLQVLFINRLANFNRITRDRNSLPALFYILLTSFSVEFMPLGAIVWANLFLILAMYNFFLLSGKFDTSVQMFNLGFFTALAGIFYQPYSFFFLFFFLRVSVLKSFKLRDIVQLITGFLLPFLFAIVMAFLMDVLPDFFRLQWSQQFTVIGSFQPVSSYHQWISPAILSLLLIFSLIIFTDIAFKRSLIVRKKISLLYQMMLFSGILIFFQRELNWQDLLILIPCLSILVASGFTQMRNQIFAELGHVILLGVMLFLHYYF